MEIHDCFLFLFVGRNLNGNKKKDKLLILLLLIPVVIFIPTVSYGAVDSNQMDTPEKASVVIQPAFMAALFGIFILILALLWFSKRNKTQKQRTIQPAPKIKPAEMYVPDPKGDTCKISLHILQGTAKGKIIEIKPTQNPLIGSTPECAVHVDAGSRVFANIMAVDDMVIIKSQSPGEVFFNGAALQGSHILENGDLIRVPGMMFRVVR